MGGLAGSFIYANFKNGQGTGGLESFADVLVKLRRSYEDRAIAIKQIQERMESGWTGAAGAVAVGMVGVRHVGVDETLSELGVLVSGLDCGTD